MDLPLPHVLVELCWRKGSCRAVIQQVLPCWCEARSCLPEAVRYWQREDTTCARPPARRGVQSSGVFWLDMPEATTEGQALVRAAEVHLLCTGERWANASCCLYSEKMCKTLTWSHRSTPRTGSRGSSRQAAASCFASLLASTMRTHWRPVACELWPGCACACRSAACCAWVAVSMPPVSSMAQIMMLSSRSLEAFASPATSRQVSRASRRHAVAAAQQHPIVVVGGGIGGLAAAAALHQVLATPSP